MKRTELKRRTPLKAKPSGRLGRSRIAAGTKRLSRSKRLRQSGGRAAREAKALSMFRRVVLAKGFCERCHSISDGHGGRLSIAPYTPCEGCKARGLEAHHRVPRSRAPAAIKHDPEKNGVCLCKPCHAAVTDHTATDWKDWIA